MAGYIEYLGHVEDAGTDNQSNFSFGSFGSEDSGRYLVVQVTTRDSVDFTATAVTIGGVSASITCQSAAVTNNTFSMIAIAAVPTGSSGSVVVDWSEAIARRQQCYLYKVLGITGTTAEAAKTKETAGAATLGDTISVSKGAAVFGVTISGDPAPTISWTGVTEDAENIEGSGVNNVSSAGSFVATAANASYTVQASFSPTPSGGQSIAMASFAPVTAFSITAATGSFTLTGQSVGLTWAARLTAGAGSFTLTGYDVGLSAGYKIAADTGSFTLTGYDVALVYDGVMVAEPGSFTFTGHDINAVWAAVLTAEAGSFTLAGYDVTFEYSGWTGVDSAGTWVVQATGATWTERANSGSWTTQTATGTWLEQADTNGWTVQ